jgi:hypothetical protein
MLSGGEDIQMIRNYLKEVPDQKTENIQITLNIIQKYNALGKNKEDSLNICYKQFLQFYLFLKLKNLELKSETQTTLKTKKLTKL